MVLCTVLYCALYGWRLIRMHTVLPVLYSAPKKPASNVPSICLFNALVFLRLITGSQLLYYQPASQYSIRVE